MSQAPIGPGFWRKRRKRGASQRKESGPSTAKGTHGKGTLPKPPWPPGLPEPSADSFPIMRKGF